MNTKFWRVASLVVCGVLLGLAVMGCGREPLPDKPTPTAAAPGRRALASEQIIAEGRVTPVRSAALGFANSGIVAEVAVTLGQQVTAGQMLLRLDTRAAELQLAQVEANLALAEAQLTELQQGASETARAAAQANLDAATAAYNQLLHPSVSALAAAQANLKAAQAAYDKLLRPDPSEVALAQSDVDKAKAAVAQAQAAYDAIGGASNPSIGMTPQAAQLQQATLEYERALNAYNAKFKPSAAQLSAAQAQVQQAKDQLARLQVAADDPQVIAAQAQIEQAKDQLARTSPSAAELAQAEASVNAARAARDLAAEQVKRGTLTAPFAGTVITLDIQPGEYAAPGASLVRLADISAWQIETTDLTELNIAQVSQGQGVTLTFDAVPGLELAGKVTRINPYGESRQGDVVYTVIITPAQQDPRLRWNMTAKVSIEAK